MLANRKVQCNGSAHDAVEQSMRRLTIHDNGGNSTVGYEPILLPVRPGEPDCTYFLKTGTCGYGSNCRYNHPSDAVQEYGVRNSGELPERDGAPNCGVIFFSHCIFCSFDSHFVRLSGPFHEFYLWTGTCKFGSACKYNHPKDGQADVLMNVLGLPMRQDAKPCPYYMRNGTCKYGHACKFHHPQPVSAPNYLPLLGTPAPLSTPTYFTHSLFQPPQSYMPFYAYPSQGWGTHMVCSSFSASSGVTAPASQLSVYCLPERPNMPQCRQFMNYGTCSYGSGCRFHHAREKILLQASSSVGSLGLTLGPAAVSTPSSGISSAKPLKLSGSAAGHKDEPLDMAKVEDSPDRSDYFPHSSGSSSEANNNAESD